MIAFIVWMAIFVAIAITLYIYQMKAIHYCHENKKWIFFFPLFWIFFPSAFEQAGEQYRRKGMYLAVLEMLWIGLFFVYGHLLDILNKQYI